MKEFSIIIAVDNENGIGKDNTLIWSIPEDMKFFKETTTKTNDQKKQNAVIMGRNTWESLPPKFSPLPERVNIVLSSTFSEKQELGNGALGFPDFSSAHKFASKNEQIENIFVIGGAQLYNAVINMPCLQRAYITRIYEKYHCDAFFDGLPLSFDETKRSGLKQSKGVEYEMFVYERKKGFINKLKNIFKK